MQSFPRIDLLRRKAEASSCMHGQNFHLQCDREKHSQTDLGRMQWIHWGLVLFRLWLHNEQICWNFRILRFRHRNKSVWIPLTVVGKIRGILYSFDQLTFQSDRQTNEQTNHSVGEKLSTAQTGSMTNNRVLFVGNLMSSQNLLMK